jgi:hypothetical protein
MVERVGCETCAHREEKDLSVNQPAIHCDDCSSHRDRWESAAKDARIKELEAECNVLGNSLATRMERERGLLQALELIHVDQETVDKKVPCLVSAAKALLMFLEDKGECEICTQGSRGDEGGVFFELDRYDRVALPHTELARLHEALDGAISDMEGSVEHG